MKHSCKILLVAICLAWIGFAFAQEKAGGPVLLSKSDLQNCPYSWVSSTRFDGTTRLQAVVDSDGRPTDVSVAGTSGSPTLDRAAVACLQKSHFQPAMRDGKPVEGKFQIDVKWIVPPSATTCSSSMPVAWEVTVGVTPSPTVPDPLPPNAESLVCICTSGTQVTEPVVLRSAGTRLDEGAITLLKKSRGMNGWTGCIAETFRFKVQPPSSTEIAR